jgi:hypothetical protein
MSVFGCTSIIQRACFAVAFGIIILAISNNKIWGITMITVKNFVLFPYFNGAIFQFKIKNVCHLTSATGRTSQPSDGWEYGDVR